MKGYWHFSAIGILSIIIVVMTEQKWLFILYFLWILWLYFIKRLGKIPIIISLAFSLFFYFFIPQLIIPSQTPRSNEAEFTGNIVSSINNTPDKIDFTLKDYSSAKKIQVTYFKKTNEKVSGLKNGATCQLKGVDEPFEKSRNPGQFDYQKYMLAKDISSNFVVRSVDDIRCSGGSKWAALYSLRSKLTEFVSKSFSTTTAAWMNALIFGEDNQLTEEVITLFQRWNLSHLLAISGLHVGLIVWLLYVSLVKLNLLTKEKARSLIVILLPIYAFVAGGEPSVWRASLMVIFFLLMKKWNVSYSVTDVLSIVFIVLILVDSYIIYHIGFQFSFCVTMGLLLSRKWLSQTDNKLFIIVKISFVSQMAILPLQIIYFHIFQPLSIVLNIFVVPYFSFFVIPLMFLLLLLKPLAGNLTGFADHLFVNIHEFFLVLLNEIDQVAYFPFVIGSFSGLAITLYYVLFFCFMKNLEEQRLKKSFVNGLLVLLLIISVTLRPYFSPYGTVTMLDIGQGDAFVIELPYRKGVILIDAGAKMSFEDNEVTNSVYKQIIKPYLLSRGIYKINGIVVSHEDTDHMGSVQFMENDFLVEKVFMSPYFNKTAKQSLIKNMKNTDFITIDANNSIRVGEHAFLVLAPSGDKFSPNENSLVLSTVLGGKSWLFTGDIGAQSEKELIERYPDLHTDVLKVAHHGSKNSTDPEFLRSVDPVYALISVGQKNRYGHPSPDVTELLNSKRIKTMRTDRQGAVQYYFKGDHGTFYTWLP